VLRLVRGNPGKRPINRREPKPRGSLVAPPEGISPQAAKVWAREIACVPPGLLKQLDTMVFLSYCVSCADFEDAAARVAKTGLMVKSPNGHPIQNPYLAIRNRQAGLVLKYAREMGFTPAARAGIALDPDDDGEQSVARKYGLD
jgi:P27 family predicted phage terminase small subunit